MIHSIRTLSASGMVGRLFDKRISPGMRLIVVRVGGPSLPSFRQKGEGLKRRTHTHTTPKKRVVGFPSREPRQTVSPVESSRERRDGQTAEVSDSTVPLKKFSRSQKIGLRDLFEAQVVGFLLSLPNHPKRGSLFSGYLKTNDLDWWFIGLNPRFS